MTAKADAFRIGAEIVANGAKSVAAAAAVTRHYGALVELQIRANASGRPGPRAPTGQYRASINAEYRISATDAVASIGTNAPQGRRLEFGFVGPDSLGRIYNQPPFPHFGPAIDKYADAYVDAVRNGIIV